MWLVRTAFTNEDATKGVIRIVLTEFATGTLDSAFMEIDLKVLNTKC